MKVNHLYNIYIHYYNYFIGIGLLKKETKNQVRVQKDFLELYLKKNNFNNNIIIDLDEDDSTEAKNYFKIEKINEEIKYINYLIKITDQKLTEYKNNTKIFNNDKNMNLTDKDLLEINGINNIQVNSGMIIAKSEEGANIEISKNKENNIPGTKKLDTNFFRIQHLNENQNSCGFCYKLNIASKNNKPINLEKLDLKAIKSKEKEKEKEKEELITIFKANNENENNINNPDNITNEILDNKSEFISNQLKNFHNDYKIRKDSLISEFSYSGNAPNNFFLDTKIFNNMNYNFL